MCSYTRVKGIVAGFDASALIERKLGAPESRVIRNSPQIPGAYVPAVSTMSANASMDQSLLLYRSTAGIVIA